jgi:hypothetical protein
MGFGIVCLGYLMIIFDSMGGGLIGWPLLFFGFLKLSEVNKSFKTSAVLSVLGLEYSIVNVLAIFEIVSGDGMLYKVSYAAYLAIVASLHISFLLAIRQLAKEGGSQRLANGAISRLYMSEVFYLWALIVIFIPSINTGTLSMLLLFFRYFVGVMNLWFLYTCFTKITTSSQIENDIAYFKNLEKKEKEKQNKRNKPKE